MPPRLALLALLPGLAIGPIEVRKRRVPLADAPLHARLGPRDLRGHPRDIVVETMVRGTAEDLGALQAVARPNEPRAQTYLRVVREAVLPPTILLRYRKDPLFPAWMTMGPLSPLAADERGRALLARGFTVELAEVEGRAPQPAWPEDAVEDDPETKRPLGVTWVEPAELGIQR